MRHVDPKIDLADLAVLEKMFSDTNVRVNASSPAVLLFALENGLNSRILKIGVNKVPFLVLRRVTVECHELEDLAILSTIKSSNFELFAVRAFTDAVFRGLSQLKNLDILQLSCGVPKKSVMATLVKLGVVCEISLSNLNRVTNDSRLVRTSIHTSLLQISVIPGRGYRGRVILSTFASNFSELKSQEDIDAIGFSVFGLKGSTLMGSEQAIRRSTFRKTQGTGFVFG